MVDEKSAFMAGFGLLANALDSSKREDGDTNASFPVSDADDFGRGARWIPGEVTLARREGKKVKFIQKCGQCCWYWQFEDGSRIYHFNRAVYNEIASANGHEFDGDYNGGNAGPCPYCQNPHTSGGLVNADEIRQAQRKRK